MKKTNKIVYTVLYHHKHGIDVWSFSSMDKAEKTCEELKKEFEGEEDYTEIFSNVVDSTISGQ